jgi:hypothetical protein
MYGVQSYTLVSIFCISPKSPVSTESSVCSICHVQNVRRIDAPWPDYCTIITECSHSYSSRWLSTHNSTAEYIDRNPDDRRPWALPIVLTTNYELCTEEICLRCTSRRCQHRSFRFDSSDPDLRPAAPQQVSVIRIRTMNSKR